MKEVKTTSKKRLAKLPPQLSATDTSNWDDRNVAAPTVDKITKKRVVRDTVFIQNKLDPVALSARQLEKLDKQNHAKKTTK